MSDFSDRERDSAPDRDKTVGSNFGGSGLIEGILADEEFVINNGNGATNHTFTFHPRGSANDTVTLTDFLQAGQSCKYSGRGIERVSIDSPDSNCLFKKGPRGTVFAATNPNGGGGAASAQFNPTDQTGITGVTALMLGLGAAGAQPSLYTPKSSGILVVTIDGHLSLSDSSAPVSVLGGIQMATGTGAAPANGAAAAGTTRGPQVTELLFGAGSSSTRAVFSITRRFVVTAGVQIWIDLQVVGGISTTLVTPGHVTVNVREAPN